MQRSFSASRRDLRVTRRDHSSFFSCLIILTALSLAGCHSANIVATVSNHTRSAISVVQVEYPSASFGTQSIGPGQDFKYRFKVLGSGQMKITFTDKSEVEHKFGGPTLNEGSEGTIAIVISDNGVAWRPTLVAK